MIFELAVNLFQSAMVLQTIRMILGDKYGRAKSNVLYLFFSLLLFLELSFINIIVPFEGIAIVISIIIIYIYAILSLQGSFIQKLFWAIFIMLLIMGMTAVIFNLEGYIIGKTYLQLVSKKDSDRFLGVIIIQIVLFYLTRFIIKGMKTEHNYVLKWNEWIVLLIIPVVSIFTMSFVSLISINAEHEMSRMQHIFSIMSVLGILTTNFLVYVLYVKLQKDHEKELEYEILQQVLKGQEKSVEETKMLYQSVRHLRHDLKQHFGVVLMMLQEKKYTEAIQYMEAYNNTVIIGFSNKVFCDNDVVNYIVNSKCGICSNKGIKTYIYIANEIPKLSDLDLCVLVGNAFDNAIEGIPSHGQKKIYLEMRTINDNFFIISIKNTISDSVLEHNPRLTSNKKEKGQHGLGILSMKEIVKRYNGSIKFSEKENKFCCDILLDIPENLQFRSDEIPNTPKC